MGTDIHGWVEVKPWWSGDWYGVIKIDRVIDRVYDMFGCLFGVRNYANFKPIAANRELPINIAKETQNELKKWDASYIHSHSRISWSEVKEIEWDEEGEALDERVHCYIRDGNGDLIYESKFGDSSKLTTEMWAALRAGETLEMGEAIYRLEKITRREVLNSSGSWEILFKLMENLASLSGEENVRLVVWFDS